jgi:hypothetical protein
LLRAQLVGLGLVSIGCLAIPGIAHAAAPPTIEATWVTNVTTNSAVLWAEINPQGQSTRYRFEYLTLTAYEANLAAGAEGFEGARAVPSAGGAGLGSASAPVPASFVLAAPSNPLSPATPYRYRVLAAGEQTTTSPPHGFRTEATGAPPALLDGRGWEMVSPPGKGGGSVGAPESIFGGGDFQAAAGGGELTYGSATAFASPPGAPPASQYLSTRGPDGWSTVDVSQALEAGGYGDQPDGAPFRLFSPDLGRGLALDGRRCTVEETCPASYSLWSPGSVQALPTVPGLRFEGATPDLGHLLFGAEGGLDEWSGGALEQISALTVRLAAPSGAISEDGSRLYFTLLEDGPTYFYEVGPGARPVPETVGGAVAFQAASSDASLAYFTRGGQLYRYDAAAEASTPIASGVAGVLAVSPDGSRVYYQDAGGLELWHEGAVRQIALGADATLPSDYPPATATVRLAAAGTVLAFLSAAPLGGSDNADADTGEPDTEVYVYDALADRLLCASCNPTGERPSGSASIPGALLNGTTTAYRPRALSADGRRLFFDTADSLVPGDTDARMDVYEWEAPGEGTCSEATGCVGLVSAGRGEGGRFLDASESGEDAFFLTGDSLLPVDPGSIDAYDARVGGGLPEPQQPIPCNGDACQPLPNAPEDPTPGTAVPNSGNPPPKIVKEKQKHKHHRRKRLKKRHHPKHHAASHARSAR